MMKTGTSLKGPSLGYLLIICRYLSLVNRRNQKKYYITMTNKSQNITGTQWQQQLPLPYCKSSIQKGGKMKIPSRVTGVTREC